MGTTAAGNDYKIPYTYVHFNKGEGMQNTNIF